MGAGGGTGFTWAKEDGTFSDGWIERLPQDLRGEASLKVLPGVIDLAKSYVSTKKLIGTKLEMPGDGATAEQLAAWRKTVGAPEKPEGYLGDAKSLRPDSVPENLWDAEGEKAFLALAHKHSLPPAAVKEILGLHAANTQAALEASKATEGETLKAEMGKLRQAFGAEFDTKVNLAARVAQTVGLSKDHAIFTNAEVVQAFAKLGALFSEDKLVKGDAAGINGSIGNKIREISDPASTHQLAKDYRGENGPERQSAAQSQLHQLMAAQSQAA